MENKTFAIFIWVGIGVLVAIIGVLVFVLMKFFKERKKKMFELEEDFDYTTDDKNNEEKKDDINNTDKVFKFEGDEGENKFGI